MSHACTAGIKIVMYKKYKSCFLQCYGKTKREQVTNYESRKNGMPFQKACPQTSPILSITPDPGLRVIHSTAVEHQGQHPPTHPCLWWIPRPPPPGLPFPLPPTLASIPHKHTTEQAQKTSNTQSTHSLKTQGGNKNQATTLPINWQELRNQYPDLWSPQTPMPRHRHRNKIISSQSNMSIPEPSNPTTPSREYSSQ